MSLKKMAAIPQRRAQQNAAEEYLDDVQGEILQSAIEMIRRGSPDDKIRRNLADAWLLSSRSANEILQRAKLYYNEPALQKFSQRDRTNIFVAAQEAIMATDQAQPTDEDYERVLGENVGRYADQYGLDEEAVMMHAYRLLESRTMRGQKIEKTANKRTARTAQGQLWGRATFRDPRSAQQFFDMLEEYRLGQMYTLAPDGTSVEFQATDADEAAQIAQLATQLGGTVDSGAMAKRHTAQDDDEPPIGSPERPEIRETGPAFKPLKKRSPQVPEEISLEAENMPAEFEAMVASVRDTNDWIQTIEEDHKVQLATLKQELLDSKKELGFDELIDQRTADVDALYDGLIELGEGAEMVARRFEDVVTVAINKVSAPQVIGPTAIRELAEMQRRLKVMDDRISKNLKRQMDRWRDQQAKHVQNITKTLMQFPATEPQRKRERKSQGIGGFLQTLGDVFRSGYDFLVSAVNELFSINTELDAIEQQLQTLEVTAQRVVRSVKKYGEVRVAVASFNKYSYPLMPNGRTECAGIVVSRRDGGCYVDFGPQVGTRFVRHESIVG